MRFSAKRAMSAEGRMRRVLRGPACDYLPCGRRTCEVFLSPARRHFYSTSCGLPSQEGTH